ncbi:hypothetical protein [Mariniblastus fucicola]|uniref:Uncharacterized protein n=1 Tax=Mariniblastus fucicola TaxID=980251 RepID=A0A5B9PQU2_9BACT|nr:hypothetical protein [Mariniblastus fucicola]QEG24851.1 hypothetical protein MFFC18_47740 [Mariniblastus fucicola]
MFDYSGIVSRLEWRIRLRIYNWELNHQDNGHDSEATRECLKMLYLLASNGAKWKPDKSELNSARRSLLKMTPDYTVEFVWILYKFDASEIYIAINLARIPTIKRHIRRLQPRLHELIQNWKEKSESCHQNTPGNTRPIT